MKDNKNALSSLYESKAFFVDFLKKSLENSNSLQPTAAKTLCDVSACSSFSTVKYCYLTKEFHSFHNRCKNRFCPFCNHFLSIQRSKIFESIYFSNKFDTDFYAVTLTVPNLSILSPSIFDVKKNFSKFIRALKKIYCDDKKFGYCYNFEMTYSAQTGFHPHLHCIFSFEKGEIVSFGRLNKIWSKINKNSDFGLQTHFKKLCADDNFFELFKYSFKPSCFKNIDSCTLIEIINLFSKKKLFVVGGFLKTKFADFEKSYLFYSTPFDGDSSASEDFPEKKDFETSHYFHDILCFDFETKNYQFLPEIINTFSDEKFIDALCAYLKLRYDFVEIVELKNFYLNLKKSFSRGNFL